MIVRSSSFTNQQNILYLVATPIGNLEEFSERAKRILNESDLIVCEDTRVTGKLLSYFGIKKPLLSMEKHNEAEVSSSVVEKILEGTKVACVSDAGYPMVSDPGQRLVKLAIEKGIPVSVINGPSAVFPALLPSGLDATHFYFEGFLPSKRSERIKRLEAIKEMPCTMVFYEAPHRINETLKDMNEVLGDREASLSRELSKIHEEYIRGTLSELLTLDGNTLKGEMVLVVAGYTREEKELSEDSLKELLVEALKNKSPSDAIKEVAKSTGLKKNEVYDFYLKNLK